MLALQGAVQLHADAVTSLGATPLEVRSTVDLADVDRLILPGGESTTMSMLLESSGLFDAIAARLADGMPVFGTCAGMILLADGVLDGRADQRSFGVLELDVRRNAYGRQVDSFEASLRIDALGGLPFPAVFIRAPVVERVGEQVDVLATVDGQPVLCREGPVMVSSFHPELSGDPRLHKLFLGEA